MINATFHTQPINVYDSLFDDLTESSERQWTDCIIDKIFKNIEIVKFITIALKNVIKLVKLQSLVAKCCIMPKI